MLRTILIAAGIALALALAGGGPRTIPTPRLNLIPR